MSNPKFAAGQDMQHLMCRNLRHAWTISKFRAATDTDKTKFGLRGRKDVIVRELTCMRCETTKLEFYSRQSKSGSFLRVKGNYQYPEGYLFKGGEADDRPDRWDYFEELLQRV